MAEDYNQQSYRFNQQINNDMPMEWEYKTTEYIQTHVPKKKS